MTRDKLTCPVCGATPNGNLPNALNCTACGTPNAFAELFASEEVFLQWNHRMDAMRLSYRNSRIQRLRSVGSLIVGPEQVAFHDAASMMLTIVSRDGRCDRLESVRQYSISNLHQLTLKADGTIVSTGAEDAGQRRLWDLRNIRHVLAAPRCTYAINDQKNVIVRGASAIRESVEQWRNVESLACGRSHLAGLTTEGRVLLADDTVSERMASAIASWCNVTAIAAAENYTLALHQNGCVSYAGPSDEEKEQTASWRDVVAISADSRYAIGLTRSGQVLMAGHCHPYLDGGRSEARNWGNVVCIGTGRSVIAAINTDGKLLLAGSFLNKEEVIARFNQVNPLKI